MNNFFLYLFSMQLTDLIDIALISYIIFRLYALFRGSTVLRVLIGIVFLWFFQRIASSMNLILTSWAIQGIIAAAAIIVIVIFRNEIRSVLQTKNLKTLLWSYSIKNTQTPIEIISDSVFELAKNNYGALIVIRAKNNLQDIVHSGITWNGSLSKEMILSIFWPGNPVHDGAAIIQGDQISQVGAILPVSGQKNLPSQYGTRHRAALGLTEQSDGIVVVVSEETGRVAIAKDGQLSFFYTQENFLKTLREYLNQGDEQRANSKKRFRLETSIAAIVSFLFVTAIWFFFARGMDTIVNLDVPIEYMSRPQKMEILDTSVNKVRFQLSGSSAILKSITPDQVQVRLDLSKGVVGDNSFTITNKNVSLPPGVLLKSIEPTVIDVELDEQVEKELPVQVDWVGKLPSHLILTDVEIKPEKIVVTGGKSILEKLSTIYTEKVRLDSIEKSGEISVNLTLNPASLKVTQGSSEKIKVNYVVKKRSSYPIQE
ncbi:MAG: diadenylate cyclase CdaA [Deltaproteobacteria bacterium]|nr:diadenylate cyclase CdaA [Deltaproteobacteria bacterium]